LLERTIEEVRIGEVLPDVETAINLRVDLKIPAAFIDEEIARLRIYKQIASTRSEADLDALYRDLEDRFGELPLPVRNLLEYARLRILGRARGVMSIERGGQGVDIKFHETAKVDPERIVELVSAGNGVSFAPPATLRLQQPARMADLFSSIETVLRELT
jgi:transcription-repair coupling factor (superfamily II helicase)